MDIRYIELKSGYSHENGPAWIGNVKASKSGQTVYFNDHAFQRYNGIQGNFIDIETGEEYWISGVKKRGSDRHWAGHGKITIDKKVVEDYLHIVEADKLDMTRFKVEEIEDDFPVERVRKLLNREE